MPTEIKDYSNIVVELAKAVKMHNFYPAGHPNLDAALKRCYGLLKQGIDARGELAWQVDTKGVRQDGAPLAPGNPEVAGLAKKLFYKKIKELHFTPRMTPADLSVLLDIVKLDPEELKAHGGAERYFAEMDVKGVLLNEMDFDNLKKLKDELEEKKEEEEERRKDEEASKAEEAAEGRAEKTPREEPRPEESKERETLEELMEKLRGEDDFLRYNDLSVRVKEKADVLKAQGEHDRLFRVLTLFASHTLESSGKDDDTRGLARERLGELLDGDVMRYLIFRAGRKDEKMREAAQALLLMYGARAIDPLLDSLIDAREASTRRNLYNTVLKFGEAIKPRIVERIDRPEWYAVRQMVALMGELRDPELLEDLERAYGHEDERIKKEVLKSLVKIPSARSKEMLLRALDEQSQSLRCQAIISIGVTRDASLVDTLGEIALKRDAFTDNQDARREAVKALGMIGSPSAIPYLGKILSRWTLFGKRFNDEIKSLAVNSLGMIDTDEALRIVAKVCESSEGELYQTCRRILEGKESRAS